MEWQEDGQSAYVTTIENCFVEIRGRGVLWSPADGARAAAWYAIGVPLGAVLRVVEARVRAWRFQHGEHARLPMHLRYYEPALLEHCRHLRRLQILPAGSGGGAVDAGADSALETTAAVGTATVTDLLAALPALIEATPQPALQHAYRAAFTLLDKGLHPPEEAEAAGARPGSTGPDCLAPPPLPADLCDLDDDAVDALLERCRTLLSRTLQKALPSPELATLAGGIDAELAPFAAQLSRKALATRRAVLIERALAARFGMRIATRQGWQDPNELA